MQSPRDPSVIYNTIAPQKLRRVRRFLHDTDEDLVFFYLIAKGYRDFCHAAGAGRLVEHSGRVS